MSGNATRLSKCSARWGLVVVAVVAVALLVDVRVTSAQAKCLDENGNPISCSNLPGDLGKGEKVTVDCGKSPYKWNAQNGNYEREFNKFCAQFTNDIADVLFHGMSLFEAQQAANTAGLSANQQVQLGTPVIEAEGPAGSEAEMIPEIELGGPPELREANEYHANQDLNTVKQAIFVSQSEATRAEADGTYNDYAGIFRFALEALERARRTRLQITQSF